jgi:hypothetical protein
MPAQRGAEISVKHVPDETAELFDHRLVQTLASPELVDQRLVGVDGQEQLGRVAREAGQEEDRDDEHGQPRCALDGASCNVAKHRVAPLPKVMPAARTNRRQAVT